MENSRAKGMAASGRTVNRLNVKQIYQLCQWLKDLAPTFDCNTSKEALAIKASYHFGFVVNSFNISTALETAEITLPKPPKSDGQKLGIIKRAIEQVYKKLGEEFPQDWQDL